jgi:hypothetical protein
LYQFTIREIKLTVLIIVKYHCYKFQTKYYRKSSSQSLSPYIDKVIGDHQYGFRPKGSATNQIFAFVRHYKKKLEYYQTTHRLFRDFIKT